MTVVNHWGKWVSDNVPVTGVVSLNSLEHIHDLMNGSTAVNISEIDRQKEFMADKVREWLATYDDMPDNTTVAEWQEEFYEIDYSEPDTFLIGSWVQGDDGLYEPGEITDNHGYAAIIRYNSGVAQVVKSRWAIRAELCSPCYPGQAYIDNDGEFMGYDFPDWVYGDRRQNVDAVRFHRVDEEGQFWQVIAPLVNRQLGIEPGAITPTSMEKSPPLYTITVQVRSVIDGIVQPNNSMWDDEELFSATAQAPRADLQQITNIARGLWNLADDQLRSIPAD